MYRANGARILYLLQMAGRRGGERDNIADSLMESRIGSVAEQIRLIPIQYKVLDVT